MVGVERNCDDKGVEKMDKYIVYNSRVEHKEETDFEYEVGEHIRVNSVERMACVKKEVIEGVGILHYFLDVNTIKNNKIERLHQENELLKAKWEAQGLMIQKLHKEIERFEKVLKNISEMETVGWNRDYVVKRYSEYAMNALNGKFED